MRARRLTLIGLCVVGMLAFACATAWATAVPRWYGKETDTWVSENEEVGLVELTSPETLQIQGELEVIDPTRSPTKRPQISNCLARGRESVENPAETTLPGTAQMEEFEVVCEKGTGNQNKGQPAPCRIEEGFELKGTSLNWPSMIETIVEAKAIQYVDDFTSVHLEVYCLKEKTHAEFSGFLKPQVSTHRGGQEVYNIDRMKFNGATSGELEEPTSGERFYFKGSDFMLGEKYKNVRVTAIPFEREAGALRRLRSSSKSHARSACRGSASRRAHRSNSAGSGARAASARPASRSRAAAKCAARSPRRARRAKR